MNKPTEEEHDEWAAMIEQHPDTEDALGQLLINGKPATGLREFIMKMSEESNLNWWELAHVLLFYAMEQIAAADVQAQDTEALRRISLSIAGLYGTHHNAISKADSVIINPANRTVN